MRSQRPRPLDERGWKCSADDSGANDPRNRFAIDPPDFRLERGDESDGSTCSGRRTRTPNDWTRTSCVANYTIPERRHPVRLASHPGTWRPDFPSYGPEFVSGAVSSKAAGRGRCRRAEMRRSDQRPRQVPPAGSARPTVTASSGTPRRSGRLLQPRVVTCGHGRGR